MKNKLVNIAMKKSKLWMSGKMRHFSAFLLLAALCLTSCQEYTLEDEVPAWLGTSIYDNLNSTGEYTNMVRLIEDLGYKDVLARTGSKTLFVADDAAFERFYSNNDWGVRGYNELSVSQKRMLLYGAMINNSYQLNTLSSSVGPTIGDCMRRLTATTVYDSVPIIHPEEMPRSEYWQHLIDANRSILCLKDGTVQPMIHFIEKQLQVKKITNEDYNFLMNYETVRQPGDASINGKVVVGQNIKCSNGFVHQLEEVMTPLSNMAEIIHTKSTTKKFSALLERFCAPYYNETITKEYNRLNDAAVDSVFEKRYFSERSKGGVPLSVTPEGKSVNGMLKFDPGWNSYFSNTSVSTSQNQALQQDMAVMLVPSDAAMDAYFNSGGGQVLKDYYGSWESVPDNVVSKLINNNMLNLFQSSVPSKFNSILDDANNQMGITINDVDSVYLGCNGAIYLTNKVFSPTAYSSVSFPALIDQRMNIVYWAIEQLEYDAYLNAVQAYYSFFVPTNEALTHYIDPVSYGKSDSSYIHTYLYKFFYDYDEVDLSSKVKASIWTYDLTTNTVKDSVGMASTDQVRNRLEDILEAHTVIAERDLETGVTTGDVEDGNTYYRTKGGSVLRVSNVAAGIGGMKVAGSLQMDMDQELAVSRIYTQGNGKTYILEDAPIMSTRNSVSDILASKSEFSKFAELLNGTGFLTTLMNNRATASNNISFFSRFHYTIYVPTNASIEALQQSNQLPTWEQVETLALTDSAGAAKKADIIRNFVKYHIQDNSIFVDNNPLSGNFETAALNNATKVFYPLSVVAGSNSIKLTDRLNNAREVVKTPGLYNLVAREYMYDANDNLNTRNIFSSANIVVHQINGSLFFSNNQFK